MANKQKQMLAVWGSPGGGKTVTAVKLALELSKRKKNVVLVFTDVTAPTLPAVVSEKKLPDVSVGELLAAPGMTQEQVLKTCVPCEKNPYISFLGYKAGENVFTHAEYSKEKAVDANSCKATYYRMVTLCTQKYDMGDKTLYNLVTEAFPIVLFVKKLEDNSRRVMEITECEILEDGTRQLHTLYRYHVSETSIQDGKVKVHGEFQKVSTISASLQKRLLENGMPPRLLERIAGGGVKLDTGKEETA